MFSNLSRFLAATLIAASQALAAPDLALEWVELGTDQTRSAAPAALHFRISNLGDQDAFAVLLRLPSATPGDWQTIRISPGPRAGLSIERAIGAEVLAGAAIPCLTVQLQTINANGPHDGNVENNRICLAPASGSSGQQ